MNGPSRVESNTAVPRRYIEQAGDGPFTAVVITEPDDGRSAPVLHVRFPVPPRPGARLHYRGRGWVLTQTPDENDSFLAEPLPGEMRADEPAGGVGPVSVLDRSVPRHSPV